MKKNAKRLFAALLAAATTVTNALPVAAAPKTTDIFPTQMLGSVDMSALSESVMEFLKNYYTDETVDSAFGERVKGHNTEELKNAIWKAIFLNRDSNYIDFGSLGLERGEAEQLTAEVVAEAGAEDAVMYSVESDSEGEATVMEVRLDPMYEAAYDEIDAATANTTAAEVQAASADDGIMTLAEDGQESTMEDAYKAFNEYQQFIDDNPDQFGITVPYTSVKDDSNEGGGPITSLVTIANQKVDANQDGVIDENDNGVTMLDMFKAGKIPPDQLIQIIQLFHIGNQLGVQMLGSELLAAKDEAMKVVSSDVTDPQKFLALNDWLGDKATFDMAWIMELKAPEPEVSQMYTNTVGALQQQGLPEADAQELASQLMGFWGGNQYGVLCPSMGNTGVCMSYTYAYAYLVQWAFPEIYKNDDGSWKTRLELNYIANPEKQGNAEAAIALVDDATEETPEEPEEGEDPEEPENHTYDYANPVWVWAEDYSTAVVQYACTDEGCENTLKIDAVVTSDTKEATCVDAGEKTYTATAQVEGVTEPVVDTKTVAIPATGKHNFEDGKCTVCGEVEETKEHSYDYENPEWVWAEDYSDASVQYACTDEGCDETLKIDAEITSEIKTEATCTADGEKTYTATALVNETSVSDTKTVTIPATGHTLGEPEFVWNDDNSEATAVFTCTACDETQEQKATVTDGEVTKEATCTESGTVNRTASITVGENTYTSEPVEVTVPATGHTYGDDGLCTVCGAKEPADYIWDPSAPAMVDYVRITYDASVTMYGIEQENFGSDHYWNAVKVNGNWYYVDPCYTDIYIECMSRDRVETDGNVNHLYFMFSDTSARSLYDGNFKSIDTLYENIATDTTYEDAWFAFAKSPVYKNGGKYYYFYDSTDLIGMVGSIGGLGNRASNSFDNIFNQEDDFRLVSYDKTGSDDADYTQTLINFVDGTVYTKDESGNATMKANDMIAQLYAEHEAYKDKYPSIEISCDMEGSKLYFNISNCVLSYDVETTELVKVFEYNEVTAERDLSKGLGGSAFTVVRTNDEEKEAEDTTEGEKELTTLTVENNPIASMTIKNGKMYVSVGTTVAFISGKESMNEEDTSIGYQFEETNYNPDYNSYAQNSGFGEEEINDNDEFMWSANFVDVLDMSHVTGEHTYEKVYVEASCGKNAFYENRCTECGAIEPGTRQEVEDTALDHHYVKFDEQYYTKTGDAWNTGTSYVCTICKDAKDELESGDHLGHEYTGIAAWNEDYTEATMDILCKACYGVNYDCLKGDDSIVLAEGQKADITKERTSAVDENGERSYYYDYTATVKYGEEGKEVEYKDSVRVPREEDKYDRNPFTDVPNDVWYTDPVLWAVENGITTGITDTTFEPNKTCLRAEAVTFLWRVAGKPEPEGKEDISFPDVKESSYYYKAVLWAAENGITTGFGDGTFKPNETCTRGQIVTFIWRMKGEEEPTDTKNPFPDIKERDYYYDAVLWAVENEITNGYEDGEFKPAKDCTRSEIVTFLYRGFNEETE